MTVRAYGILFGKIIHLPFQSHRVQVGSRGNLRVQSRSQFATLGGKRQSYNNSKVGNRIETLSPYVNTCIMHPSEDYYPVYVLSIDEMPTRGAPVSNLQQMILSDCITSFYFENFNPSS